MKTRQHHMQMKYLLAQMAIQDSERFFAVFRQSERLAYLAELWTAMGQSFPPDQQAPSEGAAVWRLPPGDAESEMIILTPPPVARNEAHFTAAVRQAESKGRVFCLEMGVMPTTVKGFTILSEFAANGRSNWGPGCEPTIKEFTELVRRVVADPLIRSLTFAPAQLG